MPHSSFSSFFLEAFILSESVEVIAFMRPDEFGYEVVKTRKKGVTYRSEFA